MEMDENLTQLLFLIENILYITYIPLNYNKKTNTCMYTFIELFKCENSDVIRNIGMFVFKAFEIRKSLMYHN